MSLWLVDVLICCLSFVLQGTEQLVSSRRYRLIVLYCFKCVNVFVKFAVVFLFTDKCGGVLC